MAFDPVESIQVPGLEAFEPHGLYVIVGPNSSGKTQLLRDVEQRLLGVSRRLVVLDSLLLRKGSSVDQFLSDLVDRKVVELREPHGLARRFAAVSPPSGMGGGPPGEVEEGNVQGWWNDWTPSATAPRSTVREVPFLRHFGTLLFTALFLENRLTLCSETSAFDPQGQAPQNDMQALSIRSDAQDVLMAELQRVFGRQVFVTPLRGNFLSFRVREGEALSDKERLAADKVLPLRTIATEGDGLKSYCAVVMALLAGRRSVCLIDEPESCLHPPQARDLGRFVGQHALQARGLVFVATHSGHILRGLLESNAEMTIIRLVRKNTGFLGHRVPPAELKKAMGSASTRATGIFDGLFADGVAIVEGDDDRVVYDAAWNRAGVEPKVDVHFVPVTGRGAVTKTASFYRSLRVPVAAIVDLDALMQPIELEGMLTALGADAGAAGHLREEARDLSETYRRQRESIAPPALASALADLREALGGGTGMSAEALHRRLNRVKDDVGKLLRIQRDYADRMGPAFTSRLDQFLSAARSHGLFLVQVGELEDWPIWRTVAGEEGMARRGVSLECARRIDAGDAAAADIRAFLVGVGQYINTKRRT